MNRIQFSKLKIQSKISRFKQEAQTAISFEALIQCLLQRLIQNKKHPAFSETKINSEQSENDPTEKTIAQEANKENILVIDEDSEDEKQSEVQVDNHFTEWQGRDQEKVFKNSTVMQEQFERVFNKKLGLSIPSKKRESYSYRKQEKEMLQKVYDQLKDPKEENCVTFERMYQFFQDCNLFFTVYGISNFELEDIVSCSAHKYPNKLTKEEFLELFLINTQSRTYDKDLENNVQKKCIMEDVNWDELKNLFNQLDTFGRGKIKTTEFLHKMKTVSASRELLECRAINFPSINRSYTFSKVLFELEHKMSLPKEIAWTDLKSLICNFTHIEEPTLDEIVKKQIMNASISQYELNTFLIKEDTIKILKDEFSRCPKFNEHFVKCKYFCDQLLSHDEISARSKQLVRVCPKGKGYINLLTNIRMLNVQGPQYFDKDEMLTYFSVKGFEAEAKVETLKKSFSAQSTTSQEEWEEKRKNQRRAKRMRSLDQMDKIMKKANQAKYEKQEKPAFKPVTIKEFNLTKPREQMTIRERKVKQMIEEKHQREQSELKSFIPANPIPASSNGQRYLQEQAKQHAKRQLEKEKKQKERELDDRKIKYLMSNTKLFEKRDPFLVEEERRKYMSPQMNKEFQAKPISWYVKQRNLLHEIQNSKEEKRKNRLRQTKEKYVFGYWKKLPYEEKKSSNFRKMTIIKNLETFKNTNESLQLEFETPTDGTIKENPTPTTKRSKLGVVPDFAKLQKEFMEELEAKKRMRSPTVVKEFNLSVPKKKTEEVSDETAVKKASSPKKSVGNPEACKTQRPVAVVPMTKKFESMVESTQRKMSLKRYEAELEKFQEKERKKKCKIFAKFMKKAMREQQSSRARPESMKSTRRNNDQSAIEHENELRKIYERVLSRPFLFQTVGENQEIKKKSRKDKKSVKQERPKKVHIPSEQQHQRGISTIPPLNYIEEESPDHEEENYYIIDGEEGQYITRDDEDEEDFDGEEEYEESHNESHGNYKNSHLNQSF